MENGSVCEWSLERWRSYPCKDNTGTKSWL